MKKIEIHDLENKITVYTDGRVLSCFECGKKIIDTYTSSGIHIQADPDELVVHNVICGSFSFLMDNHPQLALLRRKLHKDKTEKVSHNELNERLPIAKSVARDGSDQGGKASTNGDHKSRKSGRKLSGGGKSKQKS